RGPDQYVCLVRKRGTGLLTVVIATARSLARIFKSLIQPSEVEMVGKSPWLVGASLSTMLMLAGPAAFAGTSSGSSGPSNAQLEQEIQALSARLDASNAANSGVRTRLSTLEQSFNDVTWTYNNGRPQIQTGDGRFQLALRARFQIDV